MSKCPLGTCSIYLISIFSIYFVFNSLFHAMKFFKKLFLFKRIGKNNLKKRNNWNHTRNCWSLSSVFMINLSTVIGHQPRNRTEYIAGEIKVDQFSFHSINQTESGFFCLVLTCVNIVWWHDRKCVISRKTDISKVFFRILETQTNRHEWAML